MSDALATSLPTTLATVELVLGLHALSGSFVDHEIEAMHLTSLAKTANRSVVGVLNEFAHLAAAGRATSATSRHRSHRDGALTGGQDLLGEDEGRDHHHGRHVHHADRQQDEEQHPAAAQAEHAVAKAHLERAGAAGATAQNDQSKGTVPPFPSVYADRRCCSGSGDNSGRLVHEAALVPGAARQRPAHSFVSWARGERPRLEDDADMVVSKR